MTEQQKPCFFLKRFSPENLLLFIRILLIAAVTNAIVFPIECQGDDDDPEITFKNKLTFNKMKPRDIFSNSSGSQYVDEGSFEPEVSWSGDVFEEGFGSGDLQQTYDQLTFTRWTNNTESNKKWLWRYIQEKDESDEPQPSISASISIEDGYGNTGRLSHKTDPSSWVDATVIDQEIEDKSNNKKWRFLGRAQFEFDISNARRSGAYRGTIYTTLTYL